MPVKPHDLSHKNDKYFITHKTYNCPFCNQGSMGFTIEEQGYFHSNNKKSTYYYVIQCLDEECAKRSFHLSNHELKINAQSFASPLLEIKRKFPSYSYAPLLDEEGKEKELDDIFFYSMPTAFFTIDENIPKVIREPLAEAEHCLKSNFFTGASACLRKSIYKLLKDKNIIEKNSKDQLIKYEDRISLLQDKFPHIPNKLFTSLKKIISLTSKEVHEHDWKDFDSKKLRLLIFITKEILKYIYVMPAEEEKRLNHLLEFEKQANAAMD